MSKANKYLGVWVDYLPMILNGIKEAHATGRSYDLQLDGEVFKSLGSRASAGYGFRMDIFNGCVPVKSGSSVARDLKIVLDNSPEFNQIAGDKYLIIRMGKDFVLQIYSKKYDSKEI